MRVPACIVFFIGFFLSCNLLFSRKQDTQEAEEPVRFSYYDPSFTLDSSSRLKTDGFYLIREIFGSYSTNGKDFHPHKPTYGYLQFFKDGFCKVGSWNGVFESPVDVKGAIGKDHAYGFWGVYKTYADTLYVEYLYNPASPGVPPFEKRVTLTGLVKENSLIITEHFNTKYAYPEVDKDSLTSSCIGWFVGARTHYDGMNNYLKNNIGIYQ